MPHADRLGEQLRRRIRPATRATVDQQEARCELLDPPRARVFSAIFRHPGITGGGIARVQGGLENPAWHLRVLRSSEWIDLQRRGWFPSGVVDGDLAAALGSIQLPAIRRVLREVLHRPGQTIVTLGIHRSTPRSTIRRSLDRLRHHGLVRTIRDGRGQRWYPAPDQARWDRVLGIAYRQAIDRLLDGLETSGTPHDFHDRAPTGAEIRFGRRDAGDLKLGAPWSIENLLALRGLDSND